MLKNPDMKEYEGSTNLCGKKKCIVKEYFTFLMKKDQSKSDEKISKLKINQQKI